MIRFNQLVRPFYAITLDLDNTLYNNDPVMDKAEMHLVSFLQSYHPALSQIRRRDYYIARQRMKLMDPEICHNVNNWRWESLKKILLQSGLSKHDAILGADCGMEIMIYWRNKINVSNSTFKALSILSSKWPLIAITNGNANPILFGLNKYFIDVLRAGIDGKSKPHEDMYILASKYLELSCKYILHVGDDLYTDIVGSIQVGMQACWINKYYFNQKNDTILGYKLFPHLEISELMSLTCFL